MTQRYPSVLLSLESKLDRATRLNRKLVTYTIALKDRIKKAEDALKQEDAPATRAQLQRLKQELKQLKPLEEFLTQEAIRIQSIATLITVLTPLEEPENQKRFNPSQNAQIKSYLRALLGAQQAYVNLPQEAMAILERDECFTTTPSEDPLKDVLQLKDAVLSDLNDPRYKTFLASIQTLVSGHRDICDLNENAFFNARVREASLPIRTSTTSFDITAHSIVPTQYMAQLQLKLDALKGAFYPKDTDGQFLTDAPFNTAYQLAKDMAKNTNEQQGFIETTQKAEEAKRLSPKNKTRQRQLYYPQMIMSEFGRKGADHRFIEPYLNLALTSGYPDLFVFDEKTERVRIHPNVSKADEALLRQAFGADGFIAQKTFAINPTDFNPEGLDKLADRFTDLQFLWQVLKCLCPISPSFSEEHRKNAYHDLEKSAAFSLQSAKGENKKLLQDLQALASSPPLRSEQSPLRRSASAAQKESAQEREGLFYGQILANQQALAEQRSKSPGFNNLLSLLMIEKGFINQIFNLEQSLTDLQNSGFMGVFKTSEIEFINAYQQQLNTLIETLKKGPNLLTLSSANKSPLDLLQALSTDSNIQDTLNPQLLLLAQSQHQFAALISRVKRIHPELSKMKVKHTDNTLLEILTDDFGKKLTSFTEASAAGWQKVLVETQSFITPKMRPAVNQKTEALQQGKHALAEYFAYHASAEATHAFQKRAPKQRDAKQTYYINHLLNLNGSNEGRAIDKSPAPFIKTMLTEAFDDLFYLDSKNKLAIRASSYDDYIKHCRVFNLDVSKNKAGELSLHPETFDVKTLTELIVSDKKHAPLWMSLKALAPVSKNYPIDHKLIHLKQLAVEIIHHRLNVKDIDVAIHQLQQTAFKEARQHFGIAAFNQTWGPNSNLMSYYKENERPFFNPKEMITHHHIKAAMLDEQRAYLEHPTPRALSFKEFVELFKIKFDKSNSTGLKKLATLMSQLDGQALSDDIKFSKATEMMQKMALERADNPWLQNKKLLFIGQGRSKEAQEAYDRMKSNDFSLSPATARSLLLCGYTAPSPREQHAQSVQNNTSAERPESP